MAAKKKRKATTTKRTAKSAKKAPAKKKKAPARKAPAKKKTGSSARTAKRSPGAAKKASSAKKPAVRLVKPRAAKTSGGPPPPPADATEISGIYERVMFSESDPYQEVREIFGHYDRDKSGVIDASEFARLCEALGMEEEEDVLQAGLSVVDADGDGKISWDEFLGWWRSLGR